MKLHISHIILIGSLTAFTACASQQPAYTWAKTDINNEGSEYIIADSACQAEAYQAIPAASSSPSNCIGMTGFAHGVCVGGNARQASNMATMRDRIYEGCMLGKGWQKQPMK